MTRTVHFVRPDADLENLLHCMRNWNVRHLPVVEYDVDTVLGVVSLADTIPFVARILQGALDVFPRAHTTARAAGHVTREPIGGTASR
jgi:predicted transcriptional regulator